MDDDPHTLRYLRDALPAAGYDPIVTGEHQKLSRIIRAKKPQLILLDLVLPGTDGIELMEHVPELADLPVIFISGYGRGETIAKALETGAADYIVKPFSATELTARIHAALRRRTEPDPEPRKPFILKELTIHYQDRRVTVADREVRLPATEYELLRVLSVNAGNLVTYDELLRQVWHMGSSTSAERVRTTVKTLRRKLGDVLAKPTYVLNERGVGYRMPTPGAVMVGAARASHYPVSGSALPARRRPGGTDTSALPEQPRSTSVGRRSLRPARGVQRRLARSLLVGGAHQRPGDAAGEPYGPAPYIHLQAGALHL